ncbi:hypothetical protein ACFQ36_09440 [Arthrobacter sp. GCM10027362]|uniref:hypothetical protein n=1 Tax=Arthrobacter sp. GCM10027362 TaxID=3273379 RepID=UPI0036400436
MRVYLRVAAVSAAVVLMLASCSVPAGPGPGAGPAPTTAPSATRPPDSPPGLRPGAQEPDVSSPPVSSGHRSARWGSYAGKREACLAVAANVAVLLLAPLSFLTDVDEEELADLEAQVAKARDQVPKALEDDFAHLEEVLAENNDDEEFDEEALHEAVQPIRNWLAANCAT